MAGFTKVMPISENDYRFKAPISSITVVEKDLLELVNGATTWALCTSSSLHFTKKAIALAAATTADTEVECVMATLHDVYEAETANNSSASHNGDMMVLTDANTVNNTGSTSTAEEGVVVQLAPVGAATEKRILCQFVGLTGIDPDLS